MSEKRLKYVPEINLYKKWRKSLRRRKNINTTGRTCISDTGFVLNSKLKNVHKVNRLQFLISHLRLNKPDIPVQEMINGRKGFNDNKKWALPLTKRSECYLCGGKATLRHHVIPLSKGGKNKVNNITPLCHPCHCKVHPHMQKGYKHQDKPIYYPALCKPKQLIVVIPPK